MIGEARRLLGIWGRAEIRAGELKEELKWAIGQAEDARNTLRSPSVSVRVSGGRVRDLSDTMVNLERICDNFDKLAKQIADEMDQLVAVKREVAGLINLLPIVQQDILRMYYGKGMNGVQIARATNYSVDRVKHLKADAERFVADRIESSRAFSSH